VILHNGSVRTGDPRLPFSRAVAIAGERIGGGVDVREGDRSLVSNERVDLDGRCVVPGFTDAHVHFLEWSLALGRLDLSQTHSHADVVAAAAAAPATPDGWLLGAGWRPERWPGGDPAPHRSALDAACGGRPVLLWAHDHHTAWLSSAALALLPHGGAPVVEREAGGEPTGLLRETAAWNAAAAVPPPGERELDAALARGLKAAHARGVTGVHDFQRDLGLGAWQRFNAGRRRRCPPSASTRSSASGCRAASATSGCGSAQSRPSPTARSARARPPCSRRSPMPGAARRCSAPRS
jgi:predicted amidohydrolase YtcJ